MTSNRLVTLLRELTANQYSDNVLLMWLSNCENTVLTDVLLASPEDCVELTELNDEKLLVPHPWDKLYLPYMQAQVAHANGEYDHYGNYIALFNAYLEEYARHILETVQPAGGEAVTHGYYLSAYAIAVEHGYKGTVEQWLASMKGDAATVEIVGADALAPGAAPTVTEMAGSTAQYRLYKLGIPQGPKGDTGGTSLPIARAYVPEGHDDAYTATGDLLPTVSVANNDEQIPAVGKGMQIVFIPMIANKTESPKLRLNDGEVIPIRMRWYTNKGTDESVPEATTNVEVGSLMRGVPYTLTFCGKYWLVDSQITSPSFDNTTRRTLQSVANSFIGASGSNKFAVPINKRNGVIGNAMISATEAEKESNQINLISEGKTKELIRKDVTAEWEAYITNNSGGAPEDFAQTLSEGDYFFECADVSIYLRFRAYATVAEESFSGSSKKTTFMLILYEDGVNYLYAFANGQKIIETEIDFNGTGNIRIYNQGVPESVITSAHYPKPTSADNGKYLGCENGKAKWLPVEVSGGGATEDTWELIDEVDCTSGDVALIDITLKKLYKAILITNCAFEKNWADMSYDTAILTGTSQIDCDLKLKDSYNLNVNLDTNGSTKRKQKFVIQRTGMTEHGYLFTITSETGAFTSGGVNQGTAKNTIWHSLGGKSFNKIKLKPTKTDVFFNNTIWIYGIAE